MPAFKNLAAAALYPLLYLLGCAVMAAVFAYPLFIWLEGDSIGFFRNLVSRGGQVLLILGLGPLAKRLGLTVSGLGFHSAFPHQLARGFAFGVLMLGLHTLALIALDIRVLNEGGFPGGERLGSILVKAVGTGLAVALLEETLFRGVLFAAVRKFSGTVAAIGISAFYYAALHFLRSRWTTEPSAIGWDTGFRIVADGFSHLVSMAPDSFLALLLAGVLLACIRAAVPHGLGYCMGLHAGWVFVIKTAKPLTHAVPGASHASLVGSYDGFIGYLAAGWMALLIAALLVGLRFNRGNRAVS